MTEEVVGVDDKAFRTRLPVPKWCQEIKKPVNLVIHEHEIIWTNRKYNGIIR